MAPAKILVLIKGLGIGGAERLISEAVPFWDREQFDYRVAYLLPWKDQLVPDLRAAGVEVDQIGNGRMGPATALSLRGFLSQTEPDLVHAHLPSAGILARLVANAPVVYTEHNVVGSYRQPTRLVNRITYGRNSRVIAVSGAVGDSVKNYRGPSRVVIPNGVAVNVTEDERQAARAELGISDDTILIVHVGNIRPHKGHRNLMAAIAALGPRAGGVMVVSIGGEKHAGDLARLEGQATQMGIEPNFRLLGRREDAVAFLAAADIVVNPSDHEGLPLVILEAMSLGKPIVATEVGGVPSVIEPGANGLLVPPGDPSSLGQALMKLVDDPGLRATMGERGRHQALSRHGLESMVASVEALYREVLEQG